MFESMTDRIAGTVLMGLDVAVEFATLGEYRLVEADGSPTPDDFQAAPLVRRPTQVAAVARDSKLLPPASTAIARAAAESAERAAARRRPAGVPLKPGARAVLPSAPRRRPAAPVLRTSGAKPVARKRGGAVETGSQLCLFGR
jgi:predicted TIM-barrel fold metal-dependent hydrolase